MTRTADRRGAVEPTPQAPAERPSRQGSPPWASAIILVTYVAIVAVIVFWPTPVDRSFELPLLRVASFLRETGLVWLAYDHVEFVGNIILFVPIGVLLTLVLPRAVHWIVPLAALSASAMVEVVQLLALPDRFGGPVDVIANTAGATLGWLVALVARASAKRRLSRLSSYGVR
ncbi:glycopeptide antibiotics resistance protein [Microbacteriaceae bacterium SG_E_30_P1]|uniref:Glycopeptide antibiotics resistance protein n=1 Tax=Antiquaquibacter oligotrophicus TaxID=2880260 RepID=A0ABT6KNV1_9MICO|nr:VanZ family protein [Antiquaquibacter oligotrophicus]MDH6181678.1 glycopeptide antibiotics resistance protein [Antiquaquibacter oligotrophicus]UDF12638.1 VanZ family protein [Antiquaquibacter oligotrophicus]